jgi:hypothetical protein
MASLFKTPRRITSLFDGGLSLLILFVTTWGTPGEYVGVSNRITWGVQRDPTCN